MKQKPKLGQNFLIDTSACHKIADALGDLSEKTVIEIGPGAGAITEILARRAKRLVAIELDRDLAPRLREHFADQPAVEIIEADVLKTDLATIPHHAGEKVGVVGNLPYYITSDILLKLFAHAEMIDRAVIMVQREVADRIAAEPGTREYGMLSATSQLYARVERVLTLPPDAFMPPPEVHSTVLRLTMRPRFAELGVEPQAFFDFLKKCFAQKRKTLAKNLRAAGWDGIALTEAFASAGIAPMARAEELNLEAMARVFQGLKSGQVAH